ncbi:trigger factor [Dysgonomonas sp. Marseille-P4361]|uniref:trigger factor n=1 Tax=Dysgonomonas sp. Marseille-P4361 TaxID=2161820 RepID=UPI000D561C7D|nr:trigger factor [Dysgonomonas sp. Marseille-P4361]
MNISLTNVDSVNAIIQISVAKADYQEKLDNAIKAFRKKANVPGFRPGTVPVGMVKKMYGKSILAEEINKMVGEGLYNYIQENKLNVLGEPLANEEKQQPIDFTIEGDYDFFFDIALSPEIKLELSDKDKVDYYKINVDEELVDKQIESYKANYGKYEKVEEGAKETDLIKGLIVELEDGKVKEGGISVEAGIVMPSYMKDKEEQAKFVGAKAGDVIVFNPGKAYEGNEAEIASLLHIEKDAVEAIAPEFNFEITEITRYKEADLDQELFDKVFGEGNVKDEGEFKARVRETIEDQFAPDSDYKFLLDAKEVLENKVGDLQFPDAFLKRWLMTTGEERTAETLDAEYPKIIADLKFHLIKEQIAKDFELQIENEDMKTIAMQAAKAQFAQYGMMNLPDEMVENYANDMLKNKENARNLLDRAMENKIIDALKSKMGLEEKVVSLDEFRKFFEKEGEAVEE